MYNINKIEMSSLAEQYPSRAECANMFVETISIFRTRRVCVLHKSTSMLRCVCVCVCCLVCKSVVLGMQMRRGAQQPAKFVEVMCVFLPGKKIDFVFYSVSIVLHNKGFN